MNMYVLRNPFLDLRTEREKKNLNLSVIFWCEITIQIHTHNNCLYDPTDSCLGLPIKKTTLSKRKTELDSFLFDLDFFNDQGPKFCQKKWYLNDCQG